MKDLSTLAFIAAVGKIIEEKLDFVLFAGDIFNTALPAIDKVKEVTKKLRELKEADIPVYIIAGSHDFSPSGKTMLDVLEHAGLCINVVKGGVYEDQLKLRFSTDKKTGAKITGMLGKKGMLDHIYYENLHRENLEQEQGYKIFMFHTALAEFKPKDLELMDAHPISLLPKGFNYYAGGHVHYIFSKEEADYGLIAYPGPLFPNNFAELEKLKCGGFYIVTADGERTSLQYAPIRIHPTISLRYDVKYQTPQQATASVMEEIEVRAKKREENAAGHSDYPETYENAIVTLRMEGTLSDGYPHDVEFNRIFEKLYEKEAYFVMKNTTKLFTKEYEEIKVEAAPYAEENIISQHVGKSNLFTAEEEKQLIITLLRSLCIEKEDGERQLDFEERIIKDAAQLLPFADMFKKRE